jgi:hypothetical protein
MTELETLRKLVEAKNQYPNREVVSLHLIFSNGESEPVETDGNDLQALLERVEWYEAALKEIANDPYQYGQRVQKIKRIAKQALEGGEVK